MSKNIPLSTAIEEYLNAKQAEGFSPHTIKNYSHFLQKVQNHFSEDPDLHTLKLIDIQKYLITINHLSKKTRHLNCVIISGLFEYHISQENVDTNIMRLVKWPKPDTLIPDPLTQEELKAIFYSAVVAKQGKDSKREFTNRQILSPYRDRGILLLLLDTGIRSSELCMLSMKNYKPDSIKVFGKGSKERRIPISETTHRAIQQYLQFERKGSPKSGPVFITNQGTSFNLMRLYTLLNKIGKRAGVHLFPHRFRHTFAIMFLRNGGNIYSLQSILGHTSLDMVKHYLKLAELDVYDAHIAASPVRHLPYNPLEDANQS